MQYVLSKEEIYFLSVLAGAQEVLGIEDIFMDQSDEEVIQKKWSQISKGLLEKGYIIQHEENNLTIQEEIAKFLSVILLPEVALAVSSSETEAGTPSDYIYVKPYMAVHLHNGKECVLTTFEGKSDFFNFIEEFFGFPRLDLSSNQYMLTISAKELDQVFESVYLGKGQEGLAYLQGYGVSDSELESMIKTLVNPKTGKTILAFRFSDKGESQALIKVATSDYGVWLLKTKSEDEYEYASIYRLGKDEMAAALFSF